MRRTVSWIATVLSLSVVAAGCANTADANKDGPKDNAKGSSQDNTKHAFDYGLGTVPSPVTAVGYTVAVNTPLSTDDVYYAQQFDGAGTNLAPDPATKTQRVAFYSGIQPHPNGTADLLFSYFGAGATNLGPNCKPGADGGNGVACHVVDQHYAPGTRYAFQIQRADGAGGPVYTAYATNQSTGQRQEIGAWTPPPNVTGFGPKGGGFAENFHRVPCVGVPAVTADYTNVTVNGRPITVPDTHTTLNGKPAGGSGCAPTSEGTVSSTGPGGYSVRTTPPAG